MNKVILIGHLGKDAETTMAGGGTVTKFSLATTETWKNKQGEKQTKTDWHSIELWNKQALEPYLLKGTKIMCEGKISYSVSEKNGAKTYFTAIRAENIEFLSAKNNETTTASAPAQTYTPAQNTPEAAPEFDAFASEEPDQLPF